MTNKKKKKLIQIQNSLFSSHMDENWASWFIIYGFFLTSPERPTGTFYTQNQKHTNGNELNKL